jgi:preprotein translocase subunit SecG
MVVTLCVVALFIVLGVLFTNGKGALLIAGYNTMAKEEQEKYDKPALCRFMGKMMFALAFSMVFWALSELYQKPFLFTVGLVLFFCVIIFMLIYLNTNNRFKK